MAHASSAPRRRSAFQMIEVWIWRLAFAAIAPFALPGPAPAPVMLEARIDAAAAERADLDAALLGAAVSTGAEAALLRVSEAGLSPATVERMHGAIARLAARMPVAVAMEGDISLDMLALAASADRIYGLETARISGGVAAEAIRGKPARRDLRLASADPEALRALLGGMQESGSDGIYASWLRRRAETGADLRGADRIRAVIGAAAGIEAGGRIRSGADARMAGALDENGTHLDARVWLFAAAGEGRMKVVPVRLRN